MENNQNKSVIELAAIEGVKYLAATDERYPLKKDVEAEMENLNKTVTVLAMDKPVWRANKTP
jgi:hypothetical protein